MVWKAKESNPRYHDVLRGSVIIIREKVSRSSVFGLLFRFLKGTKDVTTGAGVLPCQWTPPFRNWCDLCVRGSAQSNPHGQQLTQDEAISVASMDYAYMEDQGEDRGIPILVIKDRKTKAIAAHVCPKKGVMQYVVRAAAKIK